MAYNATIYGKKNGEIIFTGAGEVNENGKLLRANGLQCTGFEGTEAYHEYYMKREQGGLVDEIVVEADGADGYRNALSGLALPPAYAQS